MIQRLFRGKKKEADAMSSSEPPLVAILDDEPDLCHLLSLTLENRGYAVEVAEDGAAGLALIRKRRPAVVVLDIKMPRVNGYQVLAQMQQDPELARTPVIVFTSVDTGNEYSEEEWAKRLQVARFVAKPAEADRIGDVVKELLAQPSA